MRARMVAERSVRVGEQGFEVLVEGEGPRLALLLHGFPDDARSMLPLATRLAARGFTCAAPFLRGYGGSEPAKDGDYGLDALARDAVGLIRAVSVPPPRTMLANLVRSPVQLLRSGYMLRFQLPGAEASLRKDDLGWVDRVWNLWSPGWLPPPGRLAEVKRTLRAPGCLEAALGYYRALPLGRPSGLRPSTLRLGLGRLRVPTLVVHGDRDGCIGPEMFAHLDDAFAAPRRAVKLAGVGHFVPLEATERLSDLVAEFARAKS
jgi:pimeloyl-ACP methyl ester carboxylesterase